MARSPWPNLYLVGAPRCATTSLWAYLDQHPEIFMTEVKEPHFFSGLETPTTVRDELEYLQLFAGAKERWVGEASPSYLGNPEVPAAIHAVRPEARIVVSLREPVSRAYSAYRRRVRRGLEHRSFAEAVRAEVGHAVADTRLRPIVDSGLYADGVERYLATFGRGNVHVVFFEEFRRDVVGTMSRLFDWLDVDAAVAPSLRTDVHNSARVPRNVVTQVVLGSDRLRRAARRAVPPKYRGAIEWRLLTRTEPAAPIDDATGALLKERYAPDVARLEEILRRDVPWAEYSPAGS